MAITGHAKENCFSKMVGKTPTKYMNAVAGRWKTEMKDAYPACGPKGPGKANHSFREPPGKQCFQGIIRFQLGWEKMRGTPRDHPKEKVQHVFKRAERRVGNQISGFTQTTRLGA